MISAYLNKSKHYNLMIKNMNLKIFPNWEYKRNLYQDQDGKASNTLLLFAFKGKMSHDYIFLFYEILMYKKSSDKNI